MLLSINSYYLINLKNMHSKNLLFSLVSPALAADTTLTFGPGTDFAGIKTVSVPKIISSGISVLMIAAMVIFFVILVVGGIKWITSGGDEKKVAAARSSVTNALIGLAIVFASWAIMTLLGSLFGITIFESFTLPVFY